MEECIHCSKSKNVFVFIAVKVKMHVKKLLPTGDTLELPVANIFKIKCIDALDSEQTIYVKNLYFKYYVKWARYKLILPSATFKDDALEDRGLNICQM